MYNTFFEELANNSSRNFKIDQLKTKVDDEILKQIINLSLNPFIQFYQRKIPDYSPIEVSQYSWNDIFKILLTLSERTVTGNAAIDVLQNLLSKLSLNDAKVVERIIQKDLKCGVAIGSVNKVWKNLIPDYPIMLCEQFDEKLLSKINFPVYVQTKEDGCRINIKVKNGSVDFFTRNGRYIDLNHEFDDVFSNNENDYILDGEMLVDSSDGVEDRQTGNGIISKAIKGTISNEELSRIRVVLWDFIPYTCFDQQQCDIPYKERFVRLNSMNFKSSRVSIVKTDVVDSFENAQEIFLDNVENGLEGVILKDMNSMWENKRSQKQLKLKAENSCELRCIEIKSGTGKYAGMIGSLICESEDHIINVDVGSGLSDDDRKKDFDYYIDKIIEVRYNTRILSKKDNSSLFLPRFVGIRFDKDIANFDKDIK